ncbi:MAG: hypothetical protein CM15mV31_0950 [uncultured marine virus]|nr:MAG: hypothetical protein CM15mV31_0950 [uncultured marine virus]
MKNCFHSSWISKKVILPKKQSSTTIRGRDIAGAAKDAVQGGLERISGHKKNEKIKINKIKKKPATPF